MIDAEQRELAVVRQMAAPPERVFAAFIEPALLVKWIGPRGSKLAGCSVDARPGGRFRFELDFGEGGVVLVGTYRAVEPVERLAFSWGIEGEGDDSEVAVLLEPNEGGTRLLLTHRGLTADEMSQNEAGWNEFFDRLDEALA